MTTCLLGVIIGSHAAFTGGTADLVLMRITEMCQVVPTFVLAAAIVSMWGPGLTRIIAVIAILAWPQVVIAGSQHLTQPKRQRLAIARALAMHPSVIVADEPLSGADVSVRGKS